MECPMFENIMNQYEDFREEDRSNYDTLTLNKVEFLTKAFHIKANKVTYMFTSDDLYCLQEGEWINDEVLNSYIKYMAVNANNLFVGYTDSFF